jgi:hypothetical protein
MFYRGCLLPCAKRLRSLNPQHDSTEINNSSGVARHKEKERKAMQTESWLKLSCNISLFKVFICDLKTFLLAIKTNGAHR